MSFPRLIVLSAVLSLLFAGAVPASDVRTRSAPEGPRPQAGAASQAAAILAAVSGPVQVERAGHPGPIAGHLGMRLLAGDTVRVGEDSSATLYLPGGGIVRVPSGNRLEIPQGRGQPPPGLNPVARMSSPSLEVLEAGLWVLNDPKGSLLVSAMRGESQPWGPRSEAEPDILSPRYETVIERRPTFFWAGGLDKARVILELGEKIVWRSEPASPSGLSYPDVPQELHAGKIYSWWLEPAGGGAPLTEKIPFRVASLETSTRALSFESEMASLSAAADGPALADLLRCAYYLESGAWSRVLGAAGRLREVHADSDLVARAITGARRQMRLDEVAMEALLEIQVRPAGNATGK